MYATAVVEGKVVRFKLSPALACAHRENRGKTMSEQEAVEFVEGKRRARALRRAKPASIASPRLVKPKQGKDFKMEVIEDAPNASV
jgi:hypothetical protein